MHTDPNIAKSNPKNNISPLIKYVTGKADKIYQKQTWTQESKFSTNAIARRNSYTRCKCTRSGCVSKKEQSTHNEAGKIRHASFSKDQSLSWRKQSNEARKYQNNDCIFVCSIISRNQIIHANLKIFKKKTDLSRNDKPAIFSLIVLWHLIERVKFWIWSHFNFSLHKIKKKQRNSSQTPNFIFLELWRNRGSKESRKKKGKKKHQIITWENWQKKVKRNSYQWKGLWY